MSKKLEFLKNHLIDWFNIYESYALVYNEDTTVDLMVSHTIETCDKIREQHGDLKAAMYKALLSMFEDYCLAKNEGYFKAKKQFLETEIDNILDSFELKERIISNIFPIEKTKKEEEKVSLNSSEKEVFKNILFAVQFHKDEGNTVNITNITKDLTKSLEPNQKAKIAKTLLTYKEEIKKLPSLDIINSLLEKV